MTTCAAIWYLCDQNEPSSPFLLELDLDQDEVTREQFEKALKAWYCPHVELLADDDRRYHPAPNQIVITDQYHYGDLAIGCKEEGKLIESLDIYESHVHLTMPEALKKRLYPEMVSA